MSLPMYMSLPVHIPYLAFLSAGSSGRNKSMKDDKVWAEEYSSKVRQACFQWKNDSDQIAFMVSGKEIPPVTLQLEEGIDKFFNRFFEFIKEYSELSPYEQDLLKLCEEHTGKALEETDPMITIWFFGRQ